MTRSEIKVQETYEKVYTASSVKAFSPSSKRLFNQQKKAYLAQNSLDTETTLISRKMSSSSIQSPWPFASGEQGAGLVCDSGR